MNIKRIFLAALLAACVSTPAMAIDQPTGEVILTVTGRVTQTNVAGTAQFDAAMLKKLASRTGEMETPWTTGKVRFSGPLLRAVLDEAGAEGSTLVVKALNDYSAEVPMADAGELDTILATSMDGKTMSVRDKGPLFLVYPFDTNPELYNEKYFSRSVWQIKAIDVR
ncbi:MAG: molybdopterin-dependent oxidoreductase [Rhizobium sp.]|nr:molybdopterin-dependent oxidoreductase [Rhizobium sp.]